VRRAIYSRQFQQFFIEVLEAEVEIESMRILQEQRAGSVFVKTENSGVKGIGAAGKYLVLLE